MAPPSTPIITPTIIRMIICMTMPTPMGMITRTPTIIITTTTMALHTTPRW